MDYKPTATPHAGRVYIVTGAGNGIGAATALILAKEGANVALWDIAEGGLKDTKTKIEAAGVGKCITTACNIANGEAVEAGVQACIEAFGQLDGAANVAAMPQGSDARIGEVEDAEWDRLMSVNIGGTRNCLRSQVRKMKKGGSIVNVASVAGVWGQWKAAAYTSSKHAMIGMTKVCAKDYGPDGIRFNCICPAAVDTQMLRQGLKEMTIDEVTAMSPLRRLSQPEEHGHVISFLLSPLASYVTGSVYYVDGGFLA